MQAIFNAILYFFTRMSIPEWILLGTLTAAFTVQMVYYWGFYTGLSRYRRRVRKNKENFSTQKPPVSVVICSKNELDNLHDFLPSLLEQDYPEYEVVVVDDGSTDATADELTRLKSLYPHLQTTFVPQEAKFINSTKFALTLGIKAAKHDLLLLTDADCRPVSKHWISAMVRNFTEGTDLVLGYSGYKREHTLLNCFISYDTMTIAMQYLNFALAGHPYMGVGRNMAYRRSLFVENKGFNSHLNVNSGDDDLFVNEAGTGRNTRIEASPLSFTESLPKTTWHDWFHQKRRHLTTASRYRSGSRWLLGCEYVSRAVFYIVLTATLLQTGNPPLQLTAAAFGLIRWITQYAVINYNAYALNERKYYFGLVLLDILLPLIQIKLSLDPVFGKRSRKTTPWK